MNLIEKRILEKAKIVEPNIIKVDDFLNHQIDVKLLNEISKHFYEYFKHKNITKIVTIETSGIAIAVATAAYFNSIPVVFARKETSAILNDDCYSCEVHSYTKNKDFMIRIDKRFLNQDDHILIIDDFLANAQALLGLLSIAKQAKASVEGIGIVIEKSFQVGRNIIEKEGYDIFSLARIKSINHGQIEFISQ